MQSVEATLPNLRAAVRDILDRKRAVSIPANRRDRVRFLRQFPGIEVEVARELELSRSHICKVVHRNSKSDRVWQALIAAIEKRLDAKRLAAKQEDAA